MATTIKSGDDLTGILGRRCGLLISTFLAGLTAAATSVLFLPDIFEANATIVIDRQQVPEAYIKSVTTTELDRRLHMIGQTILSRSSLKALIDKYGLYSDTLKTLPLEHVILQMRRDILIELRSGPRSQGGDSSTGFALTYRGREPQKTALVTNDLAQMYLNEDIKLRERQVQGTAQFLSTQLDQELRRKLEEQEARVREFKEKHRGELPQQEAANLATLQRLSGELLLNEQKVSQARVLRDAMQRTVSGAIDSSGVSPVEQLAILRGELASLQKRYTDQFPDVVQKKADIARLESDIASGASGVAPEASSDTSGSPMESSRALMAANGQIRVLEAESRNLKRAIAEYQQRLENTPQREQEYQAISRDYQTIAKVYENLLKHSEEAHMAQNMEHFQKGAQFRILDAAVIPERPAAPNRPALFFVGVIAAVALAAGAVLVRERLDTSFHSTNDLRDAVKVPILATIHRIETESTKRRARFSVVLRASATAVGLVVIAAASYFVTRENAWLVSLLF